MTCACNVYRIYLTCMTKLLCRTMGARHTVIRTSISVILLCTCTEIKIKMKKFEIVLDAA